MGKKNNSYTASYKLKAISLAEQFGNRAAVREFGILESSVRYWRKQKEALRNTKSDSTAFHGPKAGKYRPLEDELLTYFEELRNDEDFQKKNISAYFTHPDFSAAKMEKNVRKLRAQIYIYIYIHMRYGLQLAERPKPCSSLNDESKHMNQFKLFKVGSN